MSGPEPILASSIEAAVTPKATTSPEIAAVAYDRCDANKYEQPVNTDVSQAGLQMPVVTTSDHESGKIQDFPAGIQPESSAGSRPIDEVNRANTVESAPVLNNDDELKTGPASQGEAKPKRSRRRSSSNRRGGRSSSRSSSVAVDEEAELQSPYQMFRNTLIVEESFRQQYQGMAISRRKHILFFCILVLTTGYYTYSVFINPSIYKMFNFFDRLMLMGTVITLGLFHLTGLYTKTFIYEPRFVYSINKGLRPFNMKLVKIRKTWAEYILGLFYNPAYQSRPGRLVKLVLSARTFNQEIVESWEMYRQDYWDREWERYRRREKKRLG